MTLRKWRSQKGGGTAPALGGVCKQLQCGIRVAHANGDLMRLLERAHGGSIIGVDTGKLKSPEKIGAASGIELCAVVREGKQMTFEKRIRSRHGLPSCALRILQICPALRARRQVANRPRGCQSRPLAEAALPPRSNVLPMSISLPDESRFCVHGQKGNCPPIPLGCFRKIGLRNEFAPKHAELKTNPGNREWRHVLVGRQGVFIGPLGGAKVAKVGQQGRQCDIIFQAARFDDISAPCV